jgi:hypothetical protein
LGLRDSFAQGDQGEGTRKEEKEINLVANGHLGIPLKRAPMEKVEAMVRWFVRRGEDGASRQQFRDSFNPPPNGKYVPKYLGYLQHRGCIEQRGDICYATGHEPKTYACRHKDAPRLPETKPKTGPKDAPALVELDSPTMRSTL